ncbi:MAG: type II/IV secretion system ATPase subunit [Candidatus Micrarchaeota archaeon]|nr:type II/IV secretion system ATPase subunit [Candidatus Micrarchaeota archaeon]
MSDQPASEGLIDEYSFLAGEIPVNVKITQGKKDFVPLYDIGVRGLGEGTKIVLNTLKGELITDVKLDADELMNPKMIEQVTKKFEDKAMKLLDKHFLTLSDDAKKLLASYLVQSMLGLGELETPIHDENLEEVVVNGSSAPVWVFHKKHGWCKTNLLLKDEETIYEYAASIGRRIGKQITVLNPLMDATLTDGSRVNATLHPISVCGNTITIRKFSKNPWTITAVLERNTISPESASLIWLCMQNELSLVISGGTASGKTSFLNSIGCFFPPSHRIITIEDTSELTLPKHMQWVPMLTRQPNPEGKGEVTMLDLLVNALRQRPDRLLVGEIRRQREAEVLFEAMHTGHSVYATLHADNAGDTITRLTNPPISIPKSMLDALAGIVVQFRHRRLGIRRMLEFAEILRGGDINVIARWDLKTDSIKEINELSVLADTLSLYAGLSRKEIIDDIAEKTKVLKWMLKNQIRDVDNVGLVVARYYRSSDEMMEIVNRDEPWSEELGLYGK